MNQKIISVYFDLLRYAVFGVELGNEYKDGLTESEINALYTLGKKHDLAHLIAYALDENGLAKKELSVCSALQKERMVAVYRQAKMKVEYDSICNALEEAKIQFIPLKGSVIRKYYPEPWMRTSCDIDILIHREDIERAVSTLVNNLDFESKGEGTHDVSLFSRSGVHLELHFNLNEPVGKCYQLLDNVWQYSTPAKDKSYLYEMSDEVFYFYHIAHMAKHFINGGCGVRPFIDLIILCRTFNGTEGKNALLDAENLLKFNNAAVKLASVWFLGESHDDITLKMQNYIITGGTYGNIDNKVKLHSGKNSGKFGYVLSRIFLPYAEIKYYYPVLKKHPILTPFMQVRRWFRLVFCGGLRRSVTEIQTSSSVSSADARAMSEFLDEIGL